MTKFTTQFLWNSAVGTYPRLAPDRVMDIGVSVADFLDKVVGGDYAPAYQAAIDAAFANNIQKVIALPYATQIGSPVYLDPPGNLRTNPANPTMFGWTMELEGFGTNLGGVGGGTTLQPTFDNEPALWIGPGINCKVSRVAAVGQVSVAHPKLHGVNNLAFAVSGGNAGAQKTTIEDCYAQNFYGGVSLGQNNASLAEVNYIRNFNSQLLYHGVKNFSSNQVVNILENSTINASIGIDTPVQFYAVGGEYGGPSAGGPEQCQFASVSGVSALTDVSGGGVQSFTFTATIAAPASGWSSGAFNCAMLLLPHFGLVPFNIVGFNSGTSVATFQTTPIWIDMYYPVSNPNLKTQTDFDTELQAATDIYACEMITIFKGPITAEAWRTELSTSVTMIDTADSTSSYWGSLRNGFANYDITLATYYTPGTNNYAHFLAQQSFAFIRQRNSGSGAALRIENNTFPPQAGVTPGMQDTVVFDLAPTTRFIYTNNTLVNPNIRCLNSNNGSALDPAQSVTRGGYYNGDYGEFDRTIMTPRSGSSPFNNFQLRSDGSKETTYSGTKPQGGMERITPADVTALIGVTNLTNPQTITRISGNLSVQQLQHHHVSVVSASGYQNYAFAKRNGQYWSYGAALDIAGNYKGQTTVLNLTGGANQLWLFPGLEIIINAVAYVVTGVYYSLNYITVADTVISAGPVFQGNKTTVFNIASVDQSAIIMQKFGRQCEFAAVITDVNGQTFAQGDIIWQTAPVAGGSPGWMCTTAGVAGVGAVFKAMANLAA